VFKIGLDIVLQDILQLIHSDPTVRSYITYAAEKVSSRPKQRTNMKQLDLVFIFSFV